jgi:uncharacterized membrane protein YfcA
MALFSVSPAVMKPTALVLNILVASIASWKFLRAGRFSKRIFLPLAAASVPCAWLGGYLEVAPAIYKPLLGVALLTAAVRFFQTASRADYATSPPSAAALAGTGAGLGFLSGLTGVGGGIFLSPLLIFMRWASVPVTSGVAALFILINSIAGLGGQLTRTVTLPEWIPLWALAAVTGGYIGAQFGSRRLQATGIQRLLGVVLVIAGLKMLLNV